MLSAGVAFRQQLWPISVSVKRLLQRFRASIHPTTGFPGGSNRRAPAGSCAGGMPAGFEPRFGDPAKKGRSDGRCGLLQKVPSLTLVVVVSARGRAAGGPGRTARRGTGRSPTRAGWSGRGSRGWRSLRCSRSGHSRSGHSRSGLSGPGRRSRLLCGRLLGSLLG